MIQACNPYPALNHTTTYTSDGLPNTVTDARGVTRYTYDTHGNLERTLQPNGQAVNYTYDLIGNRLSMSTSAGTINYSYDPANRLTQVTDPNNAVTTFAYDNIGLRTQKALPNGVTTNYGYDTLNRLTDINQQQGGMTVASYSYILDAAGNRLNVTEADGSSIQWSYDDAYRLTNETRRANNNAITLNATFTYDPAGNRLSQNVNGSTTNYTYNSLDQLLTAGSTQYQYDLRGNMISATTSGQTAQYGYDAQNRLINTSLPDGTNITNVYDASGHRVQQSIGSQVANYLWDEASPYGDVVLETGSGNTTSYVLAGSELLSQTHNGFTSYYLQDGQGSTRTLTNTAGNVTDTYSYSAFNHRPPSSCEAPCG